MTIKVKESVFISAVNQYFTLFVQFVLGMFIARLLTPEEIGVYSIGAVVIAIAHMFRDFGIGKYLINEKKLTSKKLRAAFTLTLLISWSIALTLFIATPFLAELYKSEAIASIFYVVIFNFVLIPFGSTLMTFLRREWHYKALLVTGAASNIVQVIVTLILAVKGYSYMSLAWGSISNVITTIIVLQIYRPKDFPIAPSLKGIGDIFKFGSFASIESIFKQSGDSSPDLFIGKNLTMSDVGFFSKGFSIIQIFNFLVMGVIRPVALPYFSMIERGEQNLSEAYQKLINLITIASLLFFSFIFISAEPIIITLFGEQWYEAVKITKILAIGAAITSLASFTDLILVAKGKIKELAYFTCVFQIIRIISIAIASIYSLKWVAIILVVFNGIQTISYLTMLIKNLEIKFTSIMRVYLINFTLAIAAICPVITIQYWGYVASLNVVMHLLLNGSIWLISSFCILVLVEHQVYSDFLKPLLIKIRLYRP